MELYDKHLYVTDTVEHRRIAQMRAMDYRPEYETVAVVPSSDRDRGVYLVGEVSCLDESYSPELDVVEHRITAYVCSCDDYWFNRSQGVETGEISPKDLGVCKHVTAAFGVSME